MIEITYTRNGHGFQFVITTAVARVISNGYPDMDTCQKAALEIAYSTHGRDKVKEIFTAETSKKEEVILNKTCKRAE